MGAIYEASDNLKKWRFPKWASKFSKKYILPVLSTSTSLKKTHPTPVIPATSPSSSSSSSSSRRSPPPPPIREDDIDTMFAMFPNYSRQDIRQALVEAKSDLNRAAEIILRTEPSVGSSRGTH